MTIMISEIYDALTSAGAPEEKARKAAEALTKNDDRLGKIEADMLLLKCMMGFVLAFQVAISAKLFIH
jgi:hypothetical protein